MKFSLASASCLLLCPSPVLGLGGLKQLLGGGDSGDQDQQTSLGVDLDLDLGVDLGANVDASVDVDLDNGVGVDVNVDDKIGLSLDITYGPSCHDDLGYLFDLKIDVAIPYGTGSCAPQNPTESGLELGVEITPDCLYKIFGGDLKLNLTFSMPELWIEAYAELYGAECVPNEAEFIGIEGIPKDDFVSYECGDKWCMAIKEGKGVRNGDKIFKLETEQNAKDFRLLFQSMDSKVWLTVDADNRCGASPPCWDHQEEATCRVTSVGKDCGDYDFVISGNDGEKFRTGNVVDFLEHCAPTFPECHRETPSLAAGLLLTADVEVSLHKNGDESVVELTGNIALGGHAEVQYKCDTSEAGDSLYNFMMDLKNANYFNDAPRGCTDSPTIAPSHAPVADTCEYSVIDFATNTIGDLVATGKSVTSLWSDYGISIASGSDSESGGKGLGLALSVDASLSINSTIEASIEATVVITLDMTQQKELELEVFGATAGLSISLLFPSKSADEPDNEVTTTYGASEGSQSIVVAIEGVSQLKIAFNGPGKLTQLRVCCDSERTSAPSGLPAAIPTQSPSSLSALVPTNEEDCPSAVTLVHQVGAAALMQPPIEVVSYDKLSVTFKVKQTVIQFAQFMYVQYRKDDFGGDCVLNEGLSFTAGQTFTAHCMTSAPITIVDVYVSDISLDAKLDDAKVPQCCHAPEEDTHPTVQFTFKISCEDPCPSNVEEDVGRSDANSSQQFHSRNLRGSPAEKEG